MPDAYNGMDVYLRHPSTGLRTWPNAASGGTSTLFFSAAASVNATVLKAAPGKLFSLDFYNISAGARYIKFYNKSTAPVVGTDLPVLLFPIPAGARFALNTFVTHGVDFSVGIAFALTQAAADADATALALRDVFGAIVFE